MNQDAKNLSSQMTKYKSIDVGILNKSTNNVIDQVNKLMDKINSSSKSNGSFINYTFNLLDSYNTVQQGALGHILACVFILGCVSDLAIAIAFYGDNIF